MNKPSETTSTTSNLAKPPEAKPPEVKPPEVKPPEVKPTDSPEAFSTAVRIAEESAALGSKAQTSAEWQTIADNWGKASDLMAQVPPSDKNYTIAQDRTTRYKNNQAAALNKAPK